MWRRREEEAENVMPAVQVRDFPQEIYDRIKEEARANGRSVTQQTKYIVIEHFARIDEDEVAAGRKEPDRTTELLRTYSMVAKVPPNPFLPEDPAVIEERRARREALFARIASKKYPQEVLDVDVVQLVREMRDER